MYRITHFETDGLSVDMPQAAGDQDAGGPGIVSNILQLPSGGAFDGSATSQTPARFPAQIGVRGEIITTSATTARFLFEDLTRATGKRGSLFRCDENGDYQYCTARCLQVTATRTPRTVLVIPVEVQFAQLTPWVSQHSSGAWHVGEGWLIEEPGLRVGCYPPVEMTESPLVLTLQNLGTAPSRNIRLWIIPNGSTGSGAAAVADLTFTVTGAIDWTWTGKIEDDEDPGGLYIDAGANAILQRTLADPALNAYAVTFNTGHAIAELLCVEDYSLLELSIAWGLGTNYPILIVTAEVRDTWM